MKNINYVFSWHKKNFLNFQFQAVFITFPKTRMLMCFLIKLRNSYLKKFYVRDFKHKHNRCSNVWLKVWLRLWTETQFLINTVLGFSRRTELIESPKNPINGCSTKLDVSAGPACQSPEELDSNNQWRNASAKGYMNLPGRKRASRQKAKVSFHALCMGCLKKVWPRFRVGFPTSNDPTKKNASWECTAACNLS